MKNDKNTARGGMKRSLVLVVSLVALLLGGSEGVADAVLHSRPCVLRGDGDV